MGIRMDKPPSQMSLMDLHNCCTREMNKYRRKEECDDQFFLEILRRAVEQREEAAWEVLHRIFSENLRMWMGCHPSKEAAQRFEPEKNFADAAFTRFWRAVSERREPFPTLASVLSYLHRCLNSEILDTVRFFSRPKEIGLPDYDYEELSREDAYNENELWEVIQQILSGEEERHVAYLHFHCNFKPRDIKRYFPDLFGSVNEIYRLRRNIMDRVNRNLDVIRWKLGDTEGEGI